MASRTQIRTSISRGGVRSHVQVTKRWTTPPLRYETPWALTQRRKMNTYNIFDL